MKTDWRQAVERVMHEDGSKAPPVLEVMLRTASVLYGGAVKLRSSGYDAGILPVKRLPCQVFSIGNITAGGTGKTPMTIYLARRLMESGHRVVILSRGYGGKAEQGGAVVSDGNRLLADAETAGDEPFMMAAALKGVPVLVGGDRFSSGLRAVRAFDPDIILLDDGFQHRRLHRDLDLVLIDSRRLFGNGHLVPRGMLREPISALHRADAVVLTHSSGGKTDLPDLIGNYTDKPVFRADHMPYLYGLFDGQAPLAMNAAAELSDSGLTALEPSTAFVFSGIAQNREFVRMMENRVKAIAGAAAFADHHRYTDGELASIYRRAKAEGADLLVTTEKDYVRFAGRMPGDLPIAVIGVGIGFKDDDELHFREFIRNRLWSATNCTS